MQIMDKASPPSQR